MVKGSMSGSLAAAACLEPRYGTAFFVVWLARLLQAGLAGQLSYHGWCRLHSLLSSSKIFKKWFHNDDYSRSCSIECLLKVYGC